MEINQQKQKTNQAKQASKPKYFTLWNSTKSTQQQRKKLFIKTIKPCIRTP